MVIVRCPFLPIPVTEPAHVVGLAVCPWGRPWPGNETQHLPFRSTQIHIACQVINSLTQKRK